MQACTYLGLVCACRLVLTWPWHCTWTAWCLQGSTRGATAGHVAVAGSWLSIPAGQCFCLLGPNGAGKTTSIRCLIGVRIRREAFYALLAEDSPDSLAFLHAQALRPSGGDALVFGHSILSPGGMASARAISGKIKVGST